MDISIKTYISNVNDVLARIVMPSVNSRFARRQLSFAIDLLNQLQNRMEYRNDVIKEDTHAAKEVFDLVCATLGENHIDIPPDILPDTEKKELQEVPGADAKVACTNMEAASARALDLIYDKRNEIKNFAEIEKKILDLLMQWAQRKAKLRVPTINLESLESE